MIDFFRRRRVRLVNEHMFRRYSDAYSSTVQVLVEDTFDKFDSLSRDELLVAASEMYATAIMAILAFAEIRGTETKATVAAEGVKP